MIIKESGFRNFFSHRISYFDKEINNIREEIERKSVLSLSNLS